MMPDVQAYRLYITGVLDRRNFNKVIFTLLKLRTTKDKLVNLIHIRCSTAWFNPYPTAFPYGNGMVLHFYQQQESSTTKTVHKVINKGLKTYV